MTTPKLTTSFLDAAQRLGDHMLADLQDKEPEFAKAVAFAYEHGEALMIGFKLAANEPTVELLSVNDYGHTRRIAHIPLRMPAPSRAH